MLVANPTLIFRRLKTLQGMRVQCLERILFVVDSKSKTTFYEQIQCAATIIDVAIRQMPSIQVEWNKTYCHALELRCQVTYGHTGALIGTSSFPYFQLYLDSPDQSGCDESERSYCLWKEPYWTPFYPLVFYETFTLVPFRSFVPVSQIYMYLVLLTW